MNISSLPEGTIVGGKNAVLSKIGEGQSGVVYLAVDKEKNRDVALKFLKKTEKNYDAKARRFKEEYQKQLVGKNHPNIAGVHEFGYFEGFFYLTSEYVEGANIYAAASKLESYDEIAMLFAEIFDGLDFIHKSGLLHLDIKADNVIVKVADGKRSVKIVDFGIAAFLGDEIRWAGTPHYIAPEVVLRQKDKIDARADLFSAAVLMYYCLTGEFPFEAREKALDLKTAAEIILKEGAPAKPAGIVKDIPEYLNAIIMRLLAKNPEDRFYPNARAVANALQIKQPDLFGTKGSEPYLKPVGNKHIGRIKLQSELQTALKELAEGKQPPVYCIRGGYGFGKSHLLMKLKELSGMHAESVYVSEIIFPADETVLERWQTDLQHVMEENKRSVLILADDVHEAEAVILQNIINTIHERKKNPKLYEGIKPIMLVMAADEETPIIAPCPPCNLDRLTKSETEEYLQSTPAFKGKKIPPKWLDHFYWITSGVPLEIAANLEQMDSARAIFGLDGEIIVPAIEEPSVNLTSWRGEPKATKERLTKQYNKLEPLEREVINFISVWGNRHVTKPVTEDDIAGFFYSTSIRQTLNNLAEKGVFKNPYMQRVVYEQVAQEDREIIHDTIANYLKEDEEGILLHRGYGSPSPLVGEGRGEGAKKQSPAINLVLLAQKRIRERGDLTLAIELLKDALVIANPAKIMLKLSAYIRTLLVGCYTEAGQYSAAIEVFNDARTWLDKTFFSGMRIWKTQLCRYAISALIQQHKFDEADNVIDEAQKLIKWPATPMAISIRNYEGVYLRFYGQAGDNDLLKKARGIFEETAKLESALPKENRSRVQNNELGYILLALGEYASAVRALREKLNRHKRERNLFGEISTAVVIANTYQVLKDYGAAEEFASHALKLAKATGLGVWRLSAQRVLANTYHDSGRFQESLLENNKCLAIGAVLGTETEWSIAHNQILVQIGHSHKELNHLDKAVLYFEAAISNNVSGYYKALAYIGMAEVNYESAEFEEMKKNTALAEDVVRNLPDSLKSAGEEHIKRLNALAKTS